MKCCILGLGVFGRNLATDLAQLGAEILAIDPKEENVSLIKDEIDHAILADFNDPSILDNFPIREMDAVIVAIGDDFEKSISMTIKVQEMKAKRVVCRVLSPMHERLTSAQGGSPRGARRSGGTRVGALAFDARRCGRFRYGRQLLHH